MNILLGSSNPGVLDLWVLVSPDLSICLLQFYPICSIYTASNWDRWVHRRKGMYFLLLFFSHIRVIVEGLKLSGRLYAYVVPVQRRISIPVFAKSGSWNMTPTHSIWHFWRCCDLTCPLNKAFSCQHVVWQLMGFDFWSCAGNWRVWWHRCVYIIV